MKLLTVLALCIAFGASYLNFLVSSPRMGGGHRVFSLFFIAFPRKSHQHNQLTQLFYFWYSTHFKDMLRDLGRDVTPASFQPKEVYVGRANSHQNMLRVIDSVLIRLVISMKKMGVVSSGF